MSKFQIVKGITDNLTETPYVEGKVYFVYDDINSTDLSIYADIDGARRKITPTTFEEEDPKIHILTLQENENEELTTGEDESISDYVNNNELVIIYYNGRPHFYNKNSDRGRLYFDGLEGDYLCYYQNNWTFSDDENYLTQYDLPTNVSQLNNDAGYITQETDPTVPSWAKETTKPTYTAAEVGALPDTTVIPEDKVFIATYGKTTYADTLEAYNAGKLIFATYNSSSTGKIILPLTRKISSEFQFEGSYVVGRSEKRICNLSSSGWTTTWLQGDTVIRTVDIASGDSLIIRDLDDNSTTKSSSLTFGTETNQYLANNGTWQTVPENTSDLTNDSGFQTSTEVNSAIATAIGNINQFNVAIVSTLPTENIDAHTIYFISNGGSDDSIYDEWMYINNNWEKIGTTSIDLSGYMQTSHPANAITSTDISNWNNKSDTDEKVKQTPLNGLNNGKGLLFSNGMGSDETTNTVYTSSKITWNDYGQSLSIYNSDRSKYNSLTYSSLSLGNYSTNYWGLLRTADVTANRTYDLPDKNGTVALTSDIPTVPTTISSFTNDSGYLTSYTETDPTVPAWAKEATKPTYTAAEVGALPDTTVIPDISGKVNKSGDTMTGALNMGRQSLTFTNGGADYSQTTTLSQDYTKDSQNNNMGYLRVNGRIQCSTTPTLNNDLTNKKYVDDHIPQVYSSTNTTGYLTMATLPIYDGTVE